MTHLLKSLRRLIEISLIRGYNSIVGQLKSKSYLYISGKQGTSSKILKFLLFIAKKNKKQIENVNPQNQSIVRKQINKIETNRPLKAMNKLLLSEDFQLPDNDISCEDFAIIGRNLRKSNLKCLQFVKSF